MYISDSYTSINDLVDLKILIRSIGNEKKNHRKTDSDGVRK